MNLDQHSALDVNSIDNAPDSRLDSVLTRLSATLAELHLDCLALQELHPTTADNGSDANVIRAQAIDKVTQYLDCLAEFSAALAKRPCMQNINLNEQDYAVIKLETVKQALKTGGPHLLKVASGDLDLF